jgi:LmbE family N-acetylglucosaminyl deacetylase
MAARATALLAAVTLWAAPAGGQLAPLPLDLGANGLGLALRRLPVVGRILYVTAHPDDENNGVQVRLSRGLGLRAGLLTLTRGEGGQNEIGSERGEELGVLRTEELAAVHRYDGAEQIFGRAIDFGFSFSVDETFKRWGREETLGDVVRALRAFRPDVVLTLPLEASGGGQHHQAAAQLAREAFRAAADPARFPEQIASGLRPWQARKLYQGSVGGGTDAQEGGWVVVPTSAFDPLLGMSWQQLGILARAMHRCQGVGQIRADPLTGDGAYALVDAEPPVTGREADILDGVDISLRRLLDFVPAGSPERAPLASALDAIAADIARAQASFDPRAPEKTAAPLAAGLGSLQRLRETVLANGAIAEAARVEIGDRLEQKARDFETALALAHALAFEARADQGLVVPGQSFGVTVDVWNQGSLAVVIDDVSLTAPAGWSVERQSGNVGPLGPRESRALRYRVRLAEGAPATRSYWRRRSGGDRYDVDAPALDGRPWAPADVVARLRYVSLGGVAAHLETPAVVRYEGRWVGGEKQRTVAVVPALSVGVSPEVTVLPVEARSRVRAFRVRLTENGDTPATAKVRLEAPPGWKVGPEEAEVSFEAPGQEVVATFDVAPPAALRAGEVELRAVATQGAKEYREGYRVIAYDHIQERNVFRPATARVVVLDVRTTPDASVGYVTGTGDEVATAIEALGMPVTLLGEADLASGDLSRFSTIVTGIRAYQVRRDLRSASPRLIRYAEAGGHVVVQYNRPDSSPLAPYPGFAVTGDRITDETAPMRVLTGDRVLSLPNALSPRDWEGWVQERGLNFAAVRDARYVNLLASTDPFPNNPGEKTGILVVATVGKGTWTYTGLSLFRQLPAGVPGAYRLLANLLGRPRGGR